MNAPAVLLRVALLAALPAALVSGCGSRDSETLLESRADVMVLDQSRLVDLTYAFDGAAAGKPPLGDLLATRVRAPRRLLDGGWAAAEIPVEQLVSPAAVVDISDSVEWNPDYRLSLEDLTGWERRNGMIPGGAILLVRTGWSKTWPDPKRVFGSDTPEDPATRRYPAVSEEAARFLTGERFIDAIGIDTPFLDAGTAPEAPAERVFAEASIPCFVSVANLRHLPETGAWVIALPPKLTGAAEAPVRIVGVLPPEPAQP